MQVMDFDWFEEGATLGAHRLCLDAEMFARWTAIFPDTTGCEMAPGMASPVMMQAYAHILDRKPKGNIHGKQHFQFHRLPVMGTHITTAFHCLSKREKNGRKWMDLGLTSCGDDGEIFWTGTMTVLWAQ